MENQKINYKIISKLFKVEPITIARRLSKYDLPYNLTLEQLQILEDCWIYDTYSHIRAQKIEKIFKDIKNNYFCKEVA
jgi:hypothetical protein